MSVLGGIITDNKVFNSVAEYCTDPEIFYDSKCRALWHKFEEFNRIGKPFDIVILCNSLTSEDHANGISNSFIVDCGTAEISPGFAEFYTRQLYEKFLLRKIIAETEDVKKSALIEGEDIYQKILNTHTLMGNFLNSKPGEKFSIEDVVNEAIQDMRDKEGRIIPCGYENMDRFSGGFTRGEITVIGGRPGHGKTTLLINILSQLIHKGNRCMLFNRELPNTEVIKKLICIESQKLSYSTVRKGVYEEHDLKRLDEVKDIMLEKYSEDKFIMFDNLKSFAESTAEVKKFKPDVILDDYIQLIDIKPQGKEEQRRLMIERLVNDYKWLAKDTSAVVILASQLNRALEGRGKNAIPQLSDLAESGAIEQVAENAFFIYYEYKVDPNTKLGKNQITLVARKVRYGNTGSINMGYDGDKCTIYDTFDDYVDMTKGKPKKDKKELKNETEEELEIPW